MKPVKQYVLLVDNRRDSVAKEINGKLEPARHATDSLKEDQDKER